MELTPYGRALLHHTYVISAQLNAAAADLAAIQQGEEGPLRIGTMQSTGAHVLPMTLKGLSPSVPPSRVVLTESSDDRTLLALLERGSIDVTFTVLPFEEQGPFQTVELLQDPFVAVVPADHVLPTGRLSPKVAETGRITIEALAALPLIAYDHARSGVRADLILERHGYLPRVVLRTDDNATAQGLAAEGLGVALVPWLTITPSSSVSLLAVDPPLPPRRIGITWNSSRHKSPLIGHFVEAAMVAACSLTTEIAAAFRARPPRLRQAASGATDAVRRGRSSAVRSS